MPELNFYIEEVTFDFHKNLEFQRVILKILANESCILGDLNYIFTSDDNILKINKQFLQHDYFTDVITFDYCEGSKINGDIFISIDTVLTNSQYFKTSFFNELSRIIIHGLLHLIGYNDKSTDEKTIMTQKEDFYLQYIDFEGVAYP